METYPVVEALPASFLLYPPLAQLQCQGFLCFVLDKRAFP